MLNMMNRLSDKDLEAVTGGARRTANNDSSPYSNVRSGPGLQYDVVYTLENGDSVFTTGRHRYNDVDGFVWYQLNDGNWIQSTLIGY